MNRPSEYTSSLDALCFSPQQKAQLTERIVSAAKGAPRKIRRPIGRMAVIAACLTVLLVVGAGASGVLRPVAEVFNPLFGGSAAQTEVIDKIGRPIGASDTDNGITITADAIIGDKYNACIVFTIRRDDGTALLPEGTNVNTLLMGGFGGAHWNSMGGSHGSSWFIDEDPSDNSIQFVQTISSDESLLSQGTATAEFEDLYRWDDASGEAIPLLEGKWKFRFDVEYEDSSISLGSGEAFQQKDMTFTIDGITVSPVAVRVEYTVDSEVVWSDASSGRQPESDRRQMERYFENVEILLKKNDGTVLDLSNSGGSINPENGKTHCIKSSVLEEIIPLEELESISVGGVVYPISAS